MKGGNMDKNEKTYLGNALGHCEGVVVELT